jgi:hypothetical protein
MTIRRDVIHVKKRGKWWVAWSPTLSPGKFVGRTTFEALGKLIAHRAASNGVVIKAENETGRRMIPTPIDETVRADHLLKKHDPPQGPYISCERMGISPAAE